MSGAKRIYLDYASTTPLNLRVAEAMHEAMLAAHANPASQHRAGRAARRELEAARGTIASLLDVEYDRIDGDHVIFTSGGTEANNLALFGLAGREPGRVIVSAIEHPSVMGAAEELARRGFQVERVRVDRNGVVDLNHLRELLMASPRPRLVSIMFGNNETGVLEPVTQIAAICRERDVPFHTDAVQAVGKQRFTWKELGATALTLAPHKFQGPTGIGALVVQHRAKLEPELFGGFQQAGFRPGTESVPLAAGFATALRHALSENVWSNVAPLRDEFEARLLAELDDLVINSHDAPRLPHISNIAFLGVDRQQLFLALDFAGVYCSTGSACASGSSEPSPVLTTMALPNEVISSALRFSFGPPTTLAQVEESTSRIIKCVKDLRSRNSARK